MILFDILKLKSKNLSRIERAERQKQKFVHTVFMMTFFDLIFSYYLFKYYLGTYFCHITVFFAKIKVES